MLKRISFIIVLLVSVACIIKAQENKPRLQTLETVNATDSVFIGQIICTEPVEIYNNRRPDEFAYLYLNIDSSTSFSVKSRKITNNTKDGGQLIQFSGLIITADSLMGIPNVHVVNETKKKGIVSDLRGFFSIVAHPGDTITFSSIGYRKATYVLSDTLKEEKYSIIQILLMDNVYLDETVVYPWSTFEQFKKAFMETDIPDDDLARAKKNLNSEKMRELGISMKADANEAIDLQFRQYADALYSKGQPPPMRIFDPGAWIQFIQAIKDGKFKRQN